MVLESYAKLLKILRIIPFLLLAGCLAASAHGFSQKITLKETNAPLKKVFKEIEKQAGVQFFFSDSDLKLAKTISIETTNTDFNEVLQLCFKDQPLTYEVVDKTVVVKLKDRIIEKEITAPPPANIDIHGRIVNETGEPIEGVTVRVKGTKLGTTTNKNGEFSLTGVDQNATLLFSATNIEEFETKVNGRTEFNLNAKTKVNPLDEVQVIAYGTQTKRFSVGNSATVNAEDIAKQPVNNPLLALQGRVPGLFISQGSGYSGSRVTVQIQGQKLDICLKHSILCC